MSRTHVKLPALRHRPIGLPDGLRPTPFTPLSSPKSHAPLTSENARYPSWVDFLDGRLRRLEERTLDQLGETFSPRCRRHVSKNDDLQSPKKTKQGAGVCKGNVITSRIKTKQQLPGIQKSNKNRSYREYRQPHKGGSNNTNQARCATNKPRCEESPLKTAGTNQRSRNIRVRNSENKEKTNCSKTMSEGKPTSCENKSRNFNSNPESSDSKEKSINRKQLHMSETDFAENKKKSDKSKTINPGVNLHRNDNQEKNIGQQRKRKVSSIRPSLNNNKCDFSGTRGLANLDVLGQITNATTHNGQVQQISQEETKAKTPATQNSQVKEMAKMEEKSKTLAIQNRQVQDMVKMKKKTNNASTNMCQVQEMSEAKQKGNNAATLNDQETNTPKKQSNFKRNMSISKRLQAIHRLRSVTSETCETSLPGHVIQMLHSRRETLPDDHSMCGPYKKGLGALIISKPLKSITDIIRWKEITRKNEEVHRSNDASLLSIRSLHLPDKITFKGFSADPDWTPSWAVFRQGRTIDEIRFRLPIDMEELEVLTPLGFLSRYTRLKPPIKRTFTNIFNQFMTQKNQNFIKYEKLWPALNSLFANFLGKDNFLTIKTFILDVENDIRRITLPQFCGLSAFCERKFWSMYFDYINKGKHHEIKLTTDIADTIGKRAANFNRCPVLEYIDFGNLQSKLEGLVLSTEMDLLLKSLV